MKICFSSLACPAWTLDQVVNIAASSGYDGIELRFLEGGDSIWKLPALQGTLLQTFDSKDIGSWTCRCVRRHKLPRSLPGSTGKSKLGRRRCAYGRTRRVIRLARHSCFRR